MPSENMWGVMAASGGFRGDSFGPFKFAGGALGHGRVDSTKAGGSTLPPHPTPASSHIRHAPAMPSKAQLATHTNMRTHSCFPDRMRGPTDTSKHVHTPINETHA